MAFQKVEELLPPCQLCPNNRIVLENPHSSTLMFLSDAPGEGEDRKRRPFVGRGGREYNGLYLSTAGLDRYDVYTTNLTKCHLKNRGRDGGKALGECCSSHWLPWEIRRVKPQTIVTMGAPPLALFKKASLEIEHGFPFRGQLTRTLPGGRGEEVYWEGTVFPTYNPAAGLRSSDYMTHLLEDFRRLREFLSGNLILPVDEYPNPDYQLLNGVNVRDNLEWSNALHTPDGERPILGIDTETLPPETKGVPQIPFCATYSLVSGSGYMVSADDREGLHHLQRFIVDFRPLVLLHNGLFDLEVLERMGIVLPEASSLRSDSIWRDTMVMAYNQCSLPKALKIAARRFLGVSMLEFDDLVTPYSLARVKAYLEAVVGRGRTITKGKKVIKEVWESLWDQYRLPRQVGLDKRAQRLLTDLNRIDTATAAAEWAMEAAFAEGGEESSSEGEDYTTNPWKRWEGLPDNLRLPAEELLGPMPQKSLAHVPLNEVITYACRDADVTRRLYLEKLREALPHCHLMKR